MTRNADPSSPPSLRSAAIFSSLALVVACGGVVDPIGAEPQGGGGTTASGAGGSTGGSGGTGGGGTVQPDGCSDALAGDVSLEQATMFQALGVDLFADGEAVVPAARRAPLVQGRGAMLRATVAIDPTFTGRTLGARVSLTTPAGNQSYLAQSEIAGGTSAEFLVDIPAAAMGANVTYSVSIVECDANATGSGTSTPRFPAQGEAELGAVQTGSMRIHFVPFEINGFVPDTSQEVLDGFRDAILSVYPVTDVQVTLGAVVPDQYGGIVDMGALLVDLGVIQEQQDQAAQNVYYFGLVTGAATREEFCDSCPTGTSEDGGGYSAGFAVGAAFADQKSEDTLIQGMSRSLLM